MPLVLWPVQPIYLFRNNEITNDPDCLRAQRLHGLTNVLRQMSSISSNIEDIFTGISADLENVQLRTDEISERIERLRNASKNSLNIESTLDPELKEWAMNIKIGAPTVARNTLPEPIEKLYNACVPLPQLDKFDKFTKDGTKCMNFYSKPEFFFEQWITSFDKDIALKQEKRLKKKEDRKAANKDRKQSASSEHSKPTTICENKTFSEPIPEAEEMQLFEEELDVYANENISPTAQPISETATIISDKHAFAGMEPPSDDSIMEEPLCLTPSDIEPLAMNERSPIVSDNNIYQVNEVKAPAPAPPPPPPVPIMKVSVPAPQAPKVGGSAQSTAPKSADNEERVDLLSAIRMGKELKTVKIEEKKEVEQYAGNDVASILARRINICGDSDSEDSEEEGDDWD